MTENLNPPLFRIQRISKFPESEDDDFFEALAPNPAKLPSQNDSKACVNFDQEMLRRVAFFVEKNISTSLSVNVFPGSIGSPQFLETLQKIPLDIRRQIVLEILENSPTGKILPIFRFKALDFPIALDDYVGKKPSPKNNGGALLPHLLQRFREDFYLKIDVRQCDPSHVSEEGVMVLEKGGKIIFEKVERASEFFEIRKMLRGQFGNLFGKTGKYRGRIFFQGFHFEEPRVVHEAYIPIYSSEKGEGESIL